MEPSHVDPYARWGFWKRVYGSGWASWLDWLHYRYFGGGRISLEAEKQFDQERPERLVRQIMAGTDVIATRDVGGNFTAVAMSELEPLSAFWATGYDDDGAALEVRQLAQESLTGPSIKAMWGVVWEGRVGPFNGKPERIVRYQSWKMVDE